MNGLASILFSGPLQTPLATPDAERQGQQIETVVQRFAPSASPATLASWSSSLDGMTQALNAAEKAATGVDPAAPPQGWTEPANFQAARGLLASLKSTVVQAQTAQGVVPALAQPAKAASPAQAALQAITPKFMPPEQTGQASAKLFGAPAAVGGGKTPVPAPASDTASATPATSASGTAPTVRAAPAQTTSASASASPQPTAQATGAPPDKTPAAASPSPRAAALSVKPEAAPEAPGGHAAASTPAPASNATAPQQGAAGKSPAPAAAATLQAAASPSAQPAQTASTASAASAASGDPLAAAQSAAASPAGAGAAAQTDAADPTRAAPAAVAYLAAAIVKQANGKSTSFNIELHPAELGRVDVKLQIQSDGQLAARMSFDNPAAAANFQAHADELRRSLEQAGFQLSNDSLSFSGRDAQTANGGADGFSGHNPGQSSGQGGSGQSGAGAGAQPSASSAEAGASLQNLQAIGLDVRI